MGLKIDVYVSFAHLDNVSLTPGDTGWVSRFTRALEARLSQLLGRKAVVHLDTMLRGYDTVGDETSDLLQQSASFVAIVSPRYARSEWARREVEMFTQAAASAGQSAESPRLFAVLPQDVPLAERPPILQRAPAFEFFSVDRGTGETREFLDAKAERDFWERLDDVARGIASILEPLDESIPERDGSVVKAHETTTPERDRLQLGVSAPYRVNAGGVFTARFAAYVDSLANDVEERLRDLDAGVEGGSHTVLGVPPDRATGWRVGAPITVRVSGAHLRAQPATRSFEWNGRENLVSFLIEVDPTAPPGPVPLCFEAFIEGVSVSFIPLSLTIGVGSSAPAREVRTNDVARSAFASYASADASLVAACLSALQRWDPDLDVFMDCLDLTPNSEWQDELRRVIPQQDNFLLFWSANASRSPWVAWELQHATASKGREWIRPMPLDDPAIAPPPDELKHLHFGDRYLIARQAFLRRNDPAAGL